MFTPAYNWKRKWATTSGNGLTIATVENKVRVLHGLFGPKFRTSPGAFRLFLTGKVGFENFDVTGQSAPAGFVTTVGLGSGASYFAVYRGGGLEAFAGPIGVRAEIGDNIFFNNGAHNNLRISLGPQFRSDSLNPREHRRPTGRRFCFAPVFYLNLPVGIFSLLLMNRFVFDPTLCPTLADEHAMESRKPGIFHIGAGVGVVLIRAT